MRLQLPAGVQQLREVIRDGAKLDWGRHDHSEYVAFKSLAVAFGLLLSTMDQKDQSSEAQASKALLEITSNRWERIWTEPIKGVWYLDSSQTTLSCRPNIRCSDRFTAGFRPASRLLIGGVVTLNAAAATRLPLQPTAFDRRGTMPVGTGATFAPIR